MSYKTFVSAIGIVVFLYATAAHAVVIAEFDFESVDGVSVPNLGVGPNGTLLEGAVVADGVLKTDGLGMGLDIPLGVLSPFSGSADWSVQFDFMTEDEGGGPLFSSDNSVCEDECNDAVAAGAVNMFITDTGELVADAWFIGAMGAGEGLNDGEFHTVRLDYTSDGSLWELYVDDLEEPAADVEWEYERDATQDRTRIGDQTNPDFGFEAIDPGMDGIVAEFDNFRIDAPAPPPVLVTVNRDNGDISIENILTDDIDFNSLSITSASGSLDPAMWNSITGSLDGAGDASVSSENWSISEQSGEALVEGGEAGKLTPGQTLGAGVLWLTSPLEDVRVELFDLGLGESVPGAVNYTGEESLFADLNSDGELSELDWALFVSGFGSDLDGLSGRDGYFLADLNGDGVHNAEDFVEFTLAYDELNGGGAFEAMAASVPEPGGLSLVGLGLLCLSRVRRRRSSNINCERRTTSNAILMKRSVNTAVIITLAAIALFCVKQDAHADLLAEYTFEDGTSDTSGNNRDGDLFGGFFGGSPRVSGGVLELTGTPGEAMIIPLEDANPFDGSQDFTIDLSFTAFPQEGESGQLLLSSANVDGPDVGDNHSMSLFIEPEGDVVFDNFFVGEVRVTPPDFLIDEAQHQLRVTFTAPSSGDLEEAGTLFMRVDGVWLGSGEIAPNVVDIANHEVQLGSSLNEGFPFECEEGECFIRELLGEVDDVRIYDESFAPSAFSAEVDRATGDIKFKGGEFARDVAFYEIRSETGTLNATAWSANNLDSQNVDSLGDGTGQSWDALAGDSNRIAEGFLLGSTLFDDAKELTFSGAWAGGEEDLSLQIVTTDKSILNVEFDFMGEGNGNQQSCDPNTQGDIDGDGTVGFADFLVLSSKFGQAASGHADGDINCSGNVDFADFLVLSSNFGNTLGADVASVPEPSSWVMVLFLGLIGLGARAGRSK